MEHLEYHRYQANEISINLCELFEKKFPDVGTCQFIVRAPGRVNIIGEHIDYNGYAVLPAALEQSNYIAVGSPQGESKWKIKIVSEDENLPTYESDISAALNFAKEGPPIPLQWYHYVLCGYNGFYEYASTHFMRWEAPSLNLLVGSGENLGYVPRNAGLSSSSALVVAAALATMRASGVEVDRYVMADLCAKCERLIGTQGGGMDQAACLLADSAPLLIEFTKPHLNATHVRIPAGGVFVIADSGTRMNKAATPDYNTRVSQCKEASKMLLERLPAYTEPTAEVTLQDVQLAYGKRTPGEMLVPGGPWDATFHSKLGESVPGRRAKHCYSEAQRVVDFRDLCSRAHSSQTDPRVEDVILRELGSLMNRSHDSCRDLYNCSCAQLDRLVEVCRDAGSYGSRLTGAGWGGCVVSLVPLNHLTDFISHVAENFYGKSFDCLTKTIFSTKPGIRAGFIEISKY